MTDDPLRNRRDPLHGTAPGSSLELFREMGKLASGRPHEDVVDAACNLLINAIRQKYSGWQAAEVMFDEHFGKSKQLLKNHYDAINGRRKGIFPYDQVLSVPFFQDLDKHRGK